ncbi:putative aspartic-type endopeptidase [Podosphaera aphanis]|nr:putative aspartic-type endopeptidase [Podosphaera aphanis]
MKGLTLCVLAALIGSIEGINLRDRSPKPRVVQFSTERSQKISNPVLRDRLRKRGIVQSNLDNKETLYFFNATLGTPAQSFRLHLDTGSSDLWVNTPNSKLCASRLSPCRVSGVYDANSSSTYGYVASDFNISYVDGSGAQGDYVTDTITIGPTKIDKLQFGVGYRSSSSQGILGIGYAINEVQVGRARKKPYSNLPMRMVSEGLINSNAYSLWLNDLDASTGSILFGGVDTAQYMGPLQTLPIQRGGGSFSEFLVTLTGLSIGDVQIAEDTAQAVLLDSGSSLSYLPDDIAKAIFKQMDATYDPKEGAAYVPCSSAKKSVTVNFTFSKPVIKVDMSELVIPISTSSGQPVTFSDGLPACLFGISPAGSGTSVLGDTFLRSAYIVYDLDNNQISMAQTNFNTTASKIIEIGKGANAVPDSTPVSNPITATAGISGSSSASSSAQSEAVFMKMTARFMLTFISAGISVLLVAT